jgi:hypothetical protein
MAEQPDFPIRRTFDYTVGYPLASKAEVTTLEGREMHIIAGDGSIQHKCKNAIVNLILENYKRKKEGKPLIPLLYILDIDRNPKGRTYQNLAMNMTSKDPKYNKVVTHRELRRAYKLFSHENAVIREIARETFRFARLKNTEEETYALEPIAAPWESTGFAACWEARQKLSTSKPKQDSWRMQLDRQIARYDRLCRLQEIALGKAIAHKQKIEETLRTF